MKHIANFSLDFGNLNKTYYDLLIEEDFDFKTKDIKVDISNEKDLGVSIKANSILDIKIGATALIKSLEIIEKTLNV